MNYTDEQIAVIECDADTVTVNAGAGSGKTSMLIGYAEARPSERLLYVAFNSGVAAEARTRFPRNVDCRTSHSIAYAAFGASYKHKLGNPRAREVVDYLMTVMRPSDLGRDRYFFVQHALRLVSQFFGTGSQDRVIRADADGATLISPAGESIDYAKVVNAAQHLWLAMQDKDNLEVKLPHDGYLKLFQLSNPDLSRYSTILIDEAQDVNPCLLNIINIQRTGKVLVGDKHQNIYGFRQSINAMAAMEGEQFSLTASFRFGDTIARTANAILGTFCGERTRLRGLSTDKSSIKHTCYLHRTNAGLFDRAVELMHKRELPHFIGGIQNYGFEAIVDTWKLSAGLKDIRDPFIRRFENYSELEAYAESVDDREIKSRMYVVKNHGSHIPSYVEQLTRAETTADRATANLTTAHKSKGLEWDRVVMGDDFPEMMILDQPRTAANVKGTDEKALSVEEANLLYVMATRAKKQLDEAESMGYFLEWAGIKAVAV